MRTAIIDKASGKVVNVVELGVQPPSPNIVEFTIPPAGQLFVADAAAQIGDGYANGIFTPAIRPPPPAPARLVTVLDAATLAAALIAKGIVSQLDLNTAIGNDAGAAVAGAVASLPVNSDPLANPQQLV